MLKNRKSHFFLPLLILWILVISYQSCSGPGEFTSSSAVNHYVGSRQCMECHQEAYEDWAKSHHYFSMLPADEKSVLGDFNDVEVTLNGITSRFYKKDGKFFMFTQGTDGKYREYEIKYTFGYQPLQQYLVEFENGFIQATRLAWDTDKKEWFHLNPELDISVNEWLHWTNRSMNWNSMCSECHSTAPRKNYNDTTGTYTTQWEEINTACESCHGPGYAHIEVARNPSSLKDSLYSYLQMTSGIPPGKLVEQCAPCHSRRVTINDDYTPGDHFYDHYIPDILRQELYFPDGQILDEVFVFGSFVQSKMFHNGVACNNCHDPHSLDLKFEGNQLCLQCHEKKYDLPTHSFHKTGTEASECINCHMPGKYYMVNDFRRDHSFRIPRPDQSVKYGTPNACNQCHSDKEVEWAAKAIIEWYGPERAQNYTDMLLSTLHGEANIDSLKQFLLDNNQPDIARATLINALSGTYHPEIIEVVNQTLLDPNPMVRIESAKFFTDFSLQDRQRFLMGMLNDSMRAVRVIAAGLLAESSMNTIPPINRDPFRKAIHEYEQYLAYNSDFKSGQLLIGNYMQKTGKPGKAEEAMLKSLKIDSLFNPARLNLSLLYNRMSRNEEALDLYRTVIRLEPDYAPAYYSAGLLLAEMERFDEAEDYLKTAIEKDGSNPRIYYNYGLLLQRKGNVSEAESIFLKGIEVSDGNPDLHHAIAILYMQNGLYEKASAHIDILLSAYPDNPQYLRWRKELDQMITQ